MTLPSPLGRGFGLGFGIGLGSALAMLGCASGPASVAQERPLLGLAASGNRDRPSALVVELAPPPAATTSDEQPATQGAPDELGMAALGPMPSFGTPSFGTKDRLRIGAVQRLVRNAAATSELSPDLINGIIWVESKFDTGARGYRGSRGLMQLMPRTSRALAHELGLQHRPHQAAFSIRAGSHYFATLLRWFDEDVPTALAAYKLGPGTVRSLLDSGEPLPAVSQRYAQRVLVAAQAFRGRLGNPQATSGEPVLLSQAAEGPRGSACYDGPRCHHRR